MTLLFKMLCIRKIKNNGEGTLLALVVSGGLWEEEISLFMLHIYVMFECY